MVAPHLAGIYPFRDDSVPLAGDTNAYKYGVNYSWNLHSLTRARRKKNYMHFIILGSAPDLLFSMYGTCSQLDILSINTYKILYIYFTEYQI
jgi:hypothetical protein